MNKILLLIAISSLVACSSTNTGMQFVDKTPRGIKIINIMKEQHSKAYQTAEKHCAKYSKVPRVLKRIKQSDDSEIPMTTMITECIRPWGIPTKFRDTVIATTTSCIAQASFSIYDFTFSLQSFAMTVFYSSIYVFFTKRLFLTIFFIIFVGIRQHQTFKIALKRS